MTDSNPASTAPLTAAALRTELEAIMPRVLDSLGSLVAIPSIAWPTLDPAPVRASAEAVADLARAAGFDRVDRVQNEILNLILPVCGSKITRSNFNSLT